MRKFTEEFVEQMGKALPPVKGFEVRTITIQPEKYSAIIKIGSWYIQIYNKTFTEEQIKNMREFFGWEVENLCESQSETQTIIMQKKKLIVSIQM